MAPLGSNVAIAAVSLASLIIGYGVLAGLWVFVFREKPAERRERLAQEAALHAAYRERARAADSAGADGQISSEPQPPEAHPAEAHATRALGIRRTHRSRTPRR